LTPICPEHARPAVTAVTMVKKKLENIWIGHEPAKRRICRQRSGRGYSGQPEIM